MVRSHTDLPPACLAFRERLLAVDPELADESHLAACDNPDCLAAADRVARLDRSLDAWPTIAPLPAAAVDRIVAAVREEAMPRRQPPQPQPQSVAWFASRRFVNALSVAAAAVVVGLGVLSLMRPAEQVAVVGSEPSSPPTAAGADNRPLRPGTSGLSDGSSETATTVPAMSVSTRPVERWATERVEPIVLLPVRLADRDLWRDIASRVPKSWTDRLQAIPLPDDVDEAADPQDQTHAVPGFSRRRIVLAG